METLTRLVSESLARHGFDRPLDYRRLQWSRWFRCESHHSLLTVPSKPGVFALAEEVMDLGNGRVETGTSPVPQGGASGAGQEPQQSHQVTVEEQPLKTASGALENGASAPVARRMLAVAQFFEDEDMAFVLDRMLSRNNPMRARLESGRFFIRYVEIQDHAQRRNICNALNQWIASSSEKATGIGSHFATSLEITPANEQKLASASGSNHSAKNPALLEAVTATTVQRSPLFPSGF